jgi:aryl-alcohol dehydrogenase-like predicted oxidoreductase
MADLLEAEKIRAIGVSNFSAKKMLEVHETLVSRGLALASNQVKYSLLDRSIEHNGVLLAAKEIGATIIAYSPLEQGLLTGKFHRDPGLIRDRPGPRKWLGRFRSRGLERSRPLIAALEEIGAQHGASAASVALAWLVHFHGDTVVAIPGATKVQHVKQNVKAMIVKLSEDELARLDHLSQAVQ